MANSSAQRCLPPSPSPSSHFLPYSSLFFTRKRNMDEGAKYYCPPWSRSFNFYIQKLGSAPTPPLPLIDLAREFQDRFLTPGSFLPSSLFSPLPGDWSFPAAERIVSISFLLLTTLKLFPVAGRVHCRNSADFPRHVLRRMYGLNVALRNRTAAPSASTRPSRLPCASCCWLLFWTVYWTTRHRLTSVFSRRP